MTLTPAQLAQSLKGMGYTAAQTAQALAGPPNSLSAAVIAGALVSPSAWPALTSADLLAALQTAIPPLTQEAIAQAVSDTFSTPTIIGLSPDSADLGSGDLALTISGRGFKSGASVGWNGTALAPSSVADAQIVVTVPAAQLVQPGPNQVMVTNPGAVVSNSVTFVLNTPQPYIASISPSTIDVGTADVTLTVVGSHFTPDSVVMWNQTSIIPITVSPNGTQIIAQITNQVLRSSTTAVVAIKTAAGRLTSQSVTLTLNIPHPAIGSVAPASVLAGNPAQTLTVSGSGFASSAVLSWNGDQLSTSVTNATQLSASVAADRLQQASIATLQVTNLGYPGAPSDGFSFTVANPQPQISSLSPASGYAGDSDLQLTIYGVSFAPGVQVLWGNTSLTITHFSADQLGVTVPASLMQAVQTVNVMAINPGPGGGSSTAMPFALAPRVPSVSSASPVWAAAGCDLPISVTGNNFMAGASLSWTSGGQTSTVAATQVTPTTLTATVPGAQVIGDASFTVVNPAPGGASPQLSVKVFPGMVLQLRQSDTSYLGYYIFEMPGGDYTKFNALPASGSGDQIYTPDPSGSPKQVGWGPFTWMLVKVDGSGSVTPGPLQGGDVVRFMKDLRSCVNSTRQRLIDGRYDDGNDDTREPYYWQIGSCGADGSQLFKVYLADQLQTDQYDTVRFDRQFKAGPIVAGSTIVIMARDRTEWYRDSDGDQPELMSWTVELPPPGQAPTWDD